MQLNPRINGLKIEEQLVKPVVSFGTGGIIYAPKRWIGRNVVITLPKELTEEKILNSLKPNFAHVLGIFLTGSSARNEDTEGSDVDVLVVSSKKFKPLIQPDFDITVVELSELRKSLEENPILFYPMILEAKPVFNEMLLNELRSAKIDVSKFKWFFDSAEQSVKTINDFINDEKMQKNEFLESRAVVYSLILRIRGLYLIKCIFEKKSFSFSGFRNFSLKSGIPAKSFDKFFEVYKCEKSERKSKVKIRLAEAEKLLNFLINQMNEIKGLMLHVKKISQKRN